jgi:uncharacterized RDD family membrane protein YckC
MWECEKCKADVEDNFDVCWNCGSDKKGATISYIDNGEQVIFEESAEENSAINKDNQKANLELLLVPRNIRFYNVLIDFIAIIFITYFLLSLIGEVDENVILIFWPFVAFIYYLLFESLFGITVGKIVTKSKVINCFGEKPHFFSIFMRTLCRYIPFDAFTYLTEGEGWHGAFTGTYVIFR